MNLQTVKVALKVLLQELDNKIISTSDTTNISSIKLPDDVVFNGIDRKTLEKGIKDIVNKFGKQNYQEEPVKNVIFKALTIIFQNTTPSQRFHHLKDILEDVYNTINKKLVELKQTDLILSIEEFQRTIEEFIPLVKVTVLTNLIKSFTKNEKIKTAVKELYESILYPKISREDCYQIIRNKLEDENKQVEEFEFIDYELKLIEFNNGLLGEYFKLKINLGPFEKKECHNFFIKYLLASGDQIREHMAEITFKKEEQFYLELLPFLKNLGFDDILNFAPKCYLSKQNRFMVFDDVSFKNYSDVTNKALLTYEQLSEVYKQLAKVHACGILFEEKLSEILRKEIRLDKYYKDMVVESFAVSDGPQKLIIDCAIRTGNYLFEKFPDIFKNISLDEFKKKAEVAFNTFYEIMEPSKDGRNFFCHGDLWSNNFLFNNKSCLLVDFQLTRYCSPAYDVLFLLTVNTNNETRKKFGDKLLDEYYSNLSSILLKYKIDVDKIMTRERFLKLLEEMKPCVLSMSINYMPFILLPKKLLDDPKVSEDMFCGDRFKYIEQYWDKTEISRYRELIEDLYLTLIKC